MLQSRSLARLVRHQVPRSVTTAEDAFNEAWKVGSTPRPVSRLVTDHAHARGWFNMTCWNGLSAAQQTRLIEVGNLPLGYQPEGECPRGAEVAIETEDDAAPGPRFYCVPCAVDHLSAR